MLLKADGSSYAEIGELTGWSYTKVNRCLAEGRGAVPAALRGDRLRGGVRGAGRRVLSAIVDGRRAPRTSSRVRPHLRHCTACRATLRALYETRAGAGRARAGRCARGGRA